MFEVPPAVVMVTGTEVGEPVIVRTVTVQDVWTGPGGRRQLTAEAGLDDAVGADALTPGTTTDWPPLPESTE